MVKGRGNSQECRGSNIMEIYVAKPDYRYSFKTFRACSRGQNDGETDLTFFFFFFFLFILAARCRISPMPYFAREKMPISIYPSRVLFSPGLTASPSNFLPSSACLSIPSFVLPRLIGVPSHLRRSLVRHQFKGLSLADSVLSCNAVPGRSRMPMSRQFCLFFPVSP